MAVVAERIVDGAILALLKQWLKAPIIGVDDQGKRRTVGGGKANREGTPQGGVRHASHNVAKLAFELSVKISRQHLRPAYGAGFEGAPLSCGRSAPNASTAAVDRQRRPVLKVKTVFEPSHRGEQALIRAYAQVVPTLRRPITTARPAREPQATWLPPDCVGGRRS